MKCNQIRILGLTASALAVASVLFLLGCPRPAGVKVGAVLPMTGPDAECGKSMQRGIDLAVEDVNSAGGIHSKKLQVITIDSKSDATAGANAATRLIKADKVPAIITVLAGVTQSIMPVTEKNKVMLFTAATDPGLTEQGEYVFRNATSIRNEVDAMLNVCRERLKIKKVALVFVASPKGNWARSYFQREWESRGGQVTASEGYQPGAEIRRTQLEHIKLTNPEAIYLLAGRQDGQVMNEARQLGITSQFLGTSDFELPEVLIARAAAEGAIYTRAFFDPASGGEPMALFRKRFQARNARDPDVFAVTAYDATLIIADAINVAGADPDSARDAVLSIVDFPGLSGLTSFLPDGEADKPVELRKIENGAFVPFF
jgi:branched-chain amino acid transport system substrate-binding protein